MTTSNFRRAASFKNQSKADRLCLPFAPLMPYFHNGIARAVCHGCQFEALVLGGLTLG
jgi:hypothetical protein